VITLNYDLTYISFGAGVQSTALLALSCKGERGVPRADIAIFADTGDEPQWVYDHLALMKEWSSIPIEIVSRGNLGADTIEKARTGKRAANIPAFTLGQDGKASLLWRQCTTEYKTEPIEAMVRRKLGAKKGARVKGRALNLLGISLDEAHRMKPNPRIWCENSWPLIDARITREECHKIVEAAGCPKPMKSSCVFCPYHSNSFWQDMKVNHPGEFKRAVEFDHAIRDMSKAGVRNPIFLHRSLQPLDEVEFRDQSQLRLFDDQFGNECEGVCGV
jgi:hypothetical protein